MFLGIELNYFQEGGFCILSQFTYIQKLASKFFTLAERAHPSTVPVEANINDLLFAADYEPIFEGLYRELVGGLLYIRIRIRMHVTVCIRPDLACSSCILTQCSICQSQTNTFQNGNQSSKILVGNSILWNYTWR